MEKYLKDDSNKQKGTITMTKTELIDYVNSKPSSENFYLEIILSDKKQNTFDHDLTQEDINKLYKTH